MPIHESATREDHLNFIKIHARCGDFGATQKWVKLAIDKGFDLGQELRRFADEHLAETRINTHRSAYAEDAGYLWDELLALEDAVMTRMIIYRALED